MKKLMLLVSLFPLASIACPDVMEIGGMDKKTHEWKALESKFISNLPMVVIPLHEPKEKIFEMPVPKNLAPYTDFPAAWNGGENGMGVWFMQYKGQTNWQRSSEKLPKLGTNKNRYENDFSIVSAEGVRLAMINRCWNKACDYTIGELWEKPSGKDWKFCRKWLPE